MCEILCQAEVFLFHYHMYSHTYQESVDFLWCQKVNFIGFCKAMLILATLDEVNGFVVDLFNGVSCLFMVGSQTGLV